jgi:hypothetical protein
VAQHLSQISVRRIPDGSIAIQASPEAASTLAALFQGMTHLLLATNANQAHEERGD